VRRALLAELRGRERWLLVFDNAEDPAHVMPWLPGGSGHVLITTRTLGWDEVAAPVDVDLMRRDESVMLLRRRVQGLDATDAGLIAAAVDDLPLAVAQAAAYLTGTGTFAAEYTAMVRERAGEILSEGRPPSYPMSLAAVTRLALDRLEADSPAAAQVVRICAFLAPEPVPADWFWNAAAQLPGPLKAAAADPLAWGRVLARVSGQALARIGPQGLLMHRLTQAVIRTSHTPGQVAETRAGATALLTASHPGDTSLPSNWPGWARLLPHLLALEPVTDEALADLANHAVWYLVRRGVARDALDLARQLYRNRLSQDGPDDPRTLQAARTLAVDLWHLGEYQAARELNGDTLGRRRRVLGEDHPDTLQSAHNLAADLWHLGEYQAARELNGDTLGRRRRVLGEDHPDTLQSAHNLAADLWHLGEYQAAREMDEDTLGRRRRVLGEDHPETLQSARSLAIDLWNLGEYQAAREMDEDTLGRRRRVLGEDHPDTLWSASGLAVGLRGLGEYQAARELDEDTLGRRRRVLGEDHPDTLSSANNLAVGLRGLGEYQAARELDEDTLGRRRRVLGEDHPKTLSSANNLAVGLSKLGEAQ
jgi:tetratricopeptide (TPR) repeat protein